MENRSPLYKPLVVVIFAVTCISTHAQFKISPILGTRTYSDSEPTFRARKFYLITSPSIGFSISNPSKPVSFMIQKDWNIRASSEIETTLDRTAISGYYREIHGLVKYKFKNQLNIGLGGFIQRREHSINHELGLPIRERRGLLLEVGYPFNFLHVALRSKVFLTPDFGALVGWEDYNLVFNYDLNSKKGEFKPVSKSLNLHLTTGCRFISLSGQKTISSVEEFGPVGLSPTLGLELFHNKWHVSFNAEKDVWVSINGGSSLRTVKNQINHISYGLKYHLLLPHKHYLRFGAGYTRISDLVKSTERPIANEYYKYSNYQFRGINVSLSYQLVGNADLELRQIIPVDAYDEPALSIERFSAGIIWRFFQ